MPEAVEKQCGCGNVFVGLPGDPDLCPACLVRKRRAERIKIEPEHDDWGAISRS